MIYLAPFILLAPIPLIFLVELLFTRTPPRKENP